MKLELCRKCDGILLGQFLGQFRSFFLVIFGHFLSLLGQISAIFVNGAPRGSGPRSPSRLIANANKGKVLTVMTNLVLELC